MKVKTRSICALSIVIVFFTATFSTAISAMEKGSVNPAHLIEAGQTRSDRLFSRVSNLASSFISKTPSLKKSKIAAIENLSETEIWTSSQSSISNKPSVDQYTLFVPEFNLFTPEITTLIAEKALSFEAKFYHHDLVEVFLYGNAPAFSTKTSLAYITINGVFIHEDCRQDVRDCIKPLTNILKVILAESKIQGRNIQGEEKLHQLSHISRFYRLSKIQELSQTGDEMPVDLPETRDVSTKSRKMITLNLHTLWHYYQRIQRLCGEITGVSDQSQWASMRIMSCDCVDPEKDQIAANGAIAVEWHMGFPNAFLTPLGRLNVTRPEFNNMNSSGSKFPEFSNQKIRSGKEKVKNLLGSKRHTWSFSSIEGLNELEDASSPEHPLMSDLICATDAKQVWSLVKPRCRNG
ncbi:MAG: hypothetical protein V4544_04905 [Pseudomonadota bacterium]